MAFSRNWSDVVPAGTEVASDLDTFIQNVRGDISDRIKNMVYGFIAGENSLSQHFQYVQYYEQASVAQPSAGYGRTYCKAVGGKCEMFWQDEDGDEIQLTSGGALKSDGNLVIDGTSTLTGNVSCGGTLDVTGNIDPTTFETTNGGFLDEDDMASDSATVVASQQSIKKYVDDFAEREYSINPMTGADDSDGTITFPNGLIWKWGKKTLSANTNTDNTVTFATAFPNACFQAIACSGKSNEGTWNYQIAAHTITAASFKIRANLGARHTPARWFAVGR